jgi:hypothetical protein
MDSTSESLKKAGKKPQPMFMARQQKALVSQRPQVAREMTSRILLHVIAKRRQTVAA